MLSDRLSNQNSRSMVDLLFSVLLAMSVSGVFYYCYYLLAPWIWNQNIPYNPYDLTPWMLECSVEHDGVEIYALYILMFINSSVALIFSQLMIFCTGRYCRIVIGFICTVIAFTYCAKIGFIPPMNSMESVRLVDMFKYSLIIMTIVFFTVWCLNGLHKKSQRWMVSIVAILLLPICFTATGQISWIDYTYIFAPALRLLNGAALDNIYFQYDLLPSLFAAVWMKLGLNLNSFQVLGQAAYYVAIFSVYLLSRKLFQDKILALLLIVALIIGRLYATPYEAVLCFQVTPLRLDLWLPLLLVVFYWGPYHWSVGLICGLLILLAKNFGIIYSLAYLQLLITLFIIGYFNNDNKSKALWSSLSTYSRLCFVPITTIACAGVLSHFIFTNSDYGNYASYFQKIGFGFIQISKNSFYWFIPPVFSVVAILLWKLRKILSAKYISTGFMLLFCAIGNSIYFFGRSHEHNIINISIVLLFIFFLMLDLLARFLNGNLRQEVLLFWHHHIDTCLAVIFISVMITVYSDNIANKVMIQVENIRLNRLIYKPAFSYYSLQHSIDTIKTVTEGSKKVYFITPTDFNFYYYGGYAPVGYCNPFQTWIFVSSIRPFLQTLLDDGYYLICCPELQYMLTGLSYNYNLKLGSSVVVTKKPR